MPDAWWIARDGKQHGPLTDEELAEYFRLGRVRENDLVWHKGLAEWKPAGTFSALSSQSPAAPSSVVERERSETSTRTSLVSIHTPAVPSLLDEQPGSGTPIGKPNAAFQRIARRLSYVLTAVLWAISILVVLMDPELQDEMGYLASGLIAGIGITSAPWMIAFALCAVARQVISPLRRGYKWATSLVLIANVFLLLFIAAAGAEMTLSFAK